MKRLWTASVLLAVSLLAPRLVVAQRQRPHSYVPPNGFVPDSATAVRVAVAVWIPIYGEQQIRSEQPYVATLHGQTWTVTGSLSERSVGGVAIGGVAIAEIAKQDARILRVSHGR